MSTQEHQHNCFRVAITLMTRFRTISLGGFATTGRWASRTSSCMETPELLPMLASEEFAGL